MDETGLRQRLAAILAADVAGYSRLMSIDERATVAALDDARAVFRTQIESHQGRVIDMAGDSVLAVFETATGAVGTALAVQKQLEAQSASLPEERRMRFRIGIHLGDVIEKSDGSVYGDGVNIAARLEGLAEPGGITVSDAVRGAVGRQVAARFEDQGEQRVKNIVDPVHAFRVRAMSGAMSGRAPGGFRAPSWADSALGLDKRWWVASAVTLALVAVSAWGLLARPWAPTSPTFLPHSLSVAVMPFRVAETSAADAALAEALSQELATALGRWRMAKVAAPGLTANYKGQSFDSRRIGSELNVLYIVEGETRRLGDKIGVTARLIETENATQLWGEQLEMPALPTREQQSHLQVRLANHVISAIRGAGRDRAASRPNLLTPIDHVLRGEALFDVPAARVHYDKALQIDPQFVPALLGRYWTLAAKFMEDSRAPRAALLAEMDALTAQAVGIDSRNESAWSVRSNVLSWLGRWGEAFAASERAIALAPDRPFIVSFRAMLMVYAGRQPEAEALLLRAIAMDPPGSSMEFRHLCFARLLMGRYGEALPDCERSAALDQFFEDQMLLAAIYANQGNAEKAARARAELLKQQPGMTIANSLWMRVSDVPAYRKQLEEYANAGLRKAGIPER